MSGTESIPLLLRQTILAEVLFFLLCLHLEPGSTKRKGHSRPAWTEQPARGSFQLRVTTRRENVNHKDRQLTLHEKGLDMCSSSPLLRAASSTCFLRRAHPLFNALVEEKTCWDRMEGYRTGKLRAALVGPVMPPILAGASPSPSAAAFPAADRSCWG